MGTKYDDFTTTVKGATQQTLRLVQCILTELLFQVRDIIERIRETLSLARSNPRRAGRSSLRWLSRSAFTIPTVLTVIWLFLLNWGEVRVFDYSIQHCDWNRWESWPANANPHHLAFVADPQLVDPHTYPGRPWPLSTLTIKHTDLYLRRAYSRIQRGLDPHSIVFLGDLFDGGREWATLHSQSVDIQMRRYGENYWLREYERFSRIFLRDWTPRSDDIRLSGKRDTRRVIASLPGNHDLGFGKGIQYPVQQRFKAFFGDGNRVDILGNHTFVFVDTVSLSAEEQRSSHVFDYLWKPARYFVDHLKEKKSQAQSRHIRHLYDKPQVKHSLERKVEDLQSQQAYRSLQTLDTSSESDFPTILLSHVPLFRGPGVPCGPLREKYPPKKPPPGQDQPVNPDEPNAIPFTAGYQYQNVLSTGVTNSILEKLEGKVDYAFSGDDHDYCEVVHTMFPNRGNGIREITVKSISWAMGVRRPGFQLVSLWNPIDQNGKTSQSIEADASQGSRKTLQTQLCLLPDQLAIFIRYAIVLAFSLAMLLIRATLIVYYPRKYLSFTTQYTPLSTLAQLPETQPNTLNLNTSAETEKRQINGQKQNGRLSNFVRPSTHRHARNFEASIDKLTKGWGSSPTSSTYDERENAISSSTLSDSSTSLNARSTHQFQPVNSSLQTPIPTQDPKIIPPLSTQTHAIHNTPNIYSADGTFESTPSKEKADPFSPYPPYTNTTTSASSSLLPITSHDRYSPQKERHFIKQLVTIIDSRILWAFYRKLRRMKEGHKRLEVQSCGYRFFTTWMRSVWSVGWITMMWWAWLLRY